MEHLHTVPCQLAMVMMLVLRFSNTNQILVGAEVWQIGWEVAISNHPDIINKVGYLHWYDTSAKVWIVWIQGNGDTPLAAKYLTVRVRERRPGFGNPEGMCLRRRGFAPNMAGQEKERLQLPPKL